MAAAEDNGHFVTRRFLYRPMVLIGSAHLIITSFSLLFRSSSIDQGRIQCQLRGARLAGDTILRVIGDLPVGLRVPC